MSAVSNILLAKLRGDLASGSIKTPSKAWAEVCRRRGPDGDWESSGELVVVVSTFDVALDAGSVVSIANAQGEWLVVAAPCGGKI